MTYYDPDERSPGETKEYLEQFDAVVDGAWDITCNEAFDSGIAYGLGKRVLGVKAGVTDTEDVYPTLTAALAALAPKVAVIEAIGSYSPYADALTAAGYEVRRLIPRGSFLTKPLLQMLDGAILYVSGHEYQSGSAPLSNVYYARGFIANAGVRRLCLGGQPQDGVPNASAVLNLEEFEKCI